MVQLNNIDRDNVSEPLDFEPLQPGFYAMQITEAEQKTSAAGHDYLSLTFELDENYHPELGARKVWHILSLWHPTPKTQSIANGQLRAIEEATIGKPAGDTEELLHKTMAVKVKVEPPKGNYGPKNRAVAWEPVSARFGSQPAATPTQRPHAQPQPSGNGTAPWAKGK